MSRRKKREKETTCYMCDRPSSSREHVPPICFFPEQKDFPSDPDYRRNLITVPACDTHNLKKSGDDEYLLAVVTTHIENNEIARKLFDTKVVRAFTRRPWLLPSFLKNMFPVRMGKIQTGGFFLDNIRIDKSIDHLARGVHYHHFNKKAIGSSVVISYSIVDVTSEKRDSINQALSEWKKFSNQALKQTTKYGENPKIFYYQVVASKNDERIAIRLVFFEGVVFDVLLNDIDNGNAG